MRTLIASAALHAAQRLTLSSIVLARRFNSFDPNGNGYISLAEVDLGLRRVLGEKSAAGHTEVDALAPAIARAFHAAKDSCATGSVLGEEAVERREFRVLLVYLHRYFELFIMFKDIDASEDRRLTEDEFAAAVPKLARWGVLVRNPGSVFLTIDQNDGGFILFDGKPCANSNLRLVLGHHLT